MALISFQMPEKVVMEKNTDFHGLFEFRPLEKGYGVTIGNALRRILLSSLEGYAITGIRIPGVLHEFSTVEGVVEDVNEIILNLKMVRFKKVVDEPETKIKLMVSGKTELKAGDLSGATSSFEILNPEQIICHMESKVSLELELTIEKGRGYVAADDNKPAEQVAGYITTDAIFTPIKNVKYKVENTRVEQKTDYEKLILDIETDGSINPEDALQEAAKILIYHFQLFSKETIALDTAKPEEEETVDEEILKMRKLLKTSLADLDLSVRAYNCLKAANVKSLGDLASLEVSDMMKFRNFGKKSLAELEQLIADKGLTFGMDLSKYNLDDE
ncbi:DNA-directed RNA polymerase subunit alpha [Hyphobacterium sp. CCMP332]|nr:DNA-directed RNA polymerase subunit alpha [Hyphobacterium sp. CCMP332]